MRLRHTNASAVTVDLYTASNVNSNAYYTDANGAIALAATFTGNDQLTVIADGGASTGAIGIYIYRLSVY